MMTEESFSCWRNKNTLETLTQWGLIALEALIVSVKIQLDKRVFVIYNYDSMMFVGHR